MTPIEKLARDICWAEFTLPPKKLGLTTKAEYWRQVHPDRKAAYISHAKWLLFITKKLKPSRIWAGLVT